MSNDIKPRNSCYCYRSMVCDFHYGHRQRHRLRDSVCEPLYKNVRKLKNDFFKVPPSRINFPSCSIFMQDYEVTISMRATFLHENLITVALLLHGI